MESLTFSQRCLVLALVLWAVCLFIAPEFLFAAGPVAPVAKTGVVDSLFAGDDLATNAGVAVSGTRFAAFRDGCLVDNQTGLVWYLNGFGSLAGSGGYTTDTWGPAVSSAVSAVNGQSPCGIHDWRAANINEVMSLVDYGAVSTAQSHLINDLGFSCQVSSIGICDVLTSTGCGADCAQMVFFADGSPIDGGGVSSADMTGIAGLMNNIGFVLNVFAVADVRPFPMYNVGTPTISIFGASGGVENLGLQFEIDNTGSGRADYISWALSVGDTLQTSVPVRSGRMNPPANGKESWVAFVFGVTHSDLVGLKVWVQINGDGHVDSSSVGTSVASLLIQ